VLNTAPPFAQERLVPVLLKPNWIPKLLDVFKQAEDLDDGVTLAHMYGAVKGAIMLNDAGVLEELLKVRALRFRGIQHAVCVRVCVRVCMCV
jgi:hypothetical protein